MNPFEEVGKGIAKAAKAFAFGVAHLFGLARKVERVMLAEEPLEKPFIDGLVKVVSDVEDLLGEAQVAATDGGLNFPADSSAYQAFMALYRDARALLPIVEDALAVLEGKKEPYLVQPEDDADSEPSALVPSPGLHSVTAA